jgi:hypothetical protein
MPAMQSFFHKPTSLPATVVNLEQQGTIPARDHGKKALQAQNCHFKKV